MKVTRKKLLDELAPQVQSIATMQSNGVIAIPVPINTPLAKNYMKLNTLQKFYNEELARAKELFVQRDPKGNYLTENTARGLELKFKSSEDREKFLDRLSTWENVEEEWQPFKVNQDDLLKIPNFPMQAFATLQEFECLTEIHLAGSLKVQR